MSIYRMVGILSNGVVTSRYCRANNEMNARKVAYKALGLRAAGIKLVSTLAMLADVGTVGYDQACNADPTQALSASALRSMQSHAGADNTGRTMYKPSERQTTVLVGRGQQALREMAGISAPASNAGRVAGSAKSRFARRGLCAAG